MILFSQLQILKIDTMVAISILALIVSFFSFVVIYNKAVKNSVNKSDVDNVELKMKNYIDDKEKVLNDKSRSLHHRVDDIKADNDKDHDRIRRENADLVMGMAKQLDQIYNHLLNQKK